MQNESVEDDLKTLDSKIRRIYDIIKSDPDYMRYGYRATASAIQAMMRDQVQYKNYKNEQIEAEDEEDQE